MLKKTITYPDLDGNMVTEDFYFNLSKAEIAEMEISHDGGFGAHLQRIIESKDGAAIISTFKQIIKASVGRRSEDGRRFIKSEEIAEEFMQTEAYSQLFMELVTDAEASSKFVNGIVPSDMHEAMAAAAKQQKTENVELPEGDDGAEKAPAYILENREPTPQELQAMSHEELQQAFMWRQKNRGEQTGMV